MSKRKGIFKRWLFLFILSELVFAAGLYIYTSSIEIIAPSKQTTILYNDKGPHEESFEQLDKLDKLNKSKKSDLDIISETSKTIPEKYLYRTGNESELKKFLLNKKSNLAYEPYFSEIIKQSKKFNLNPCLLFAITGREQSFVPETHKFATKISNNPFNVFGSWEVYNTDINDSAEIACRTIIKLSKSRPKNVEFIKWINSQNGTGGYAEDVNWHYDVKTFFDILNEKVY